MSWPAKTPLVSPGSKPRPAAGPAAAGGKGAAPGSAQNGTPAPGPGGPSGGRGFDDWQPASPKAAAINIPHGAARTAVNPLAIPVGDVWSGITRSDGSAVGVGPTNERRSLPRP